MELGAETALGSSDEGNRRPRADQARAWSRLPDMGCSQCVQDAAGWDGESSKEQLQPTVKAFGFVGSGGFLFFFV